MSENAQISLFSLDDDVRREDVVRQLLPDTAETPIIASNQPVSQDAVNPSRIGSPASPPAPKVSRPAVPGAVEGLDPWLTVGQVARHFSVSIPTIWRWCQLKPSFPRPVKVAKGTTRWRRSDIAAFDQSLGR